MSIENFLDSLTDEQREELILHLATNDGQDKLDKPMKEELESNKKSIENAIDIDENFKVTRVDGSDRGGRTKVRGGKNTWSDEGEVFEDTEMPEAAKKIPKTPRDRQPPKLVDAVCSSCNKTHQVNPNLLFGEFYRCDSCGDRG